MAVTALRSPPPARTPEREALAQAIEQLRAATARRTALNSALVSADTSVRKAAAAVEDAEADVEAAKADAARHLVAVASGNEGEPPRTVRQARDRLQDCQDTLDAHRSARDQLRQQMAEPDNSDAYRLSVNMAIDRVLKAEASASARAVVDQAHKAREALVHGVMLSQFLVGRNVVERNTIGGLHLLSQYPLTEDYDAARDAATARWREVVERLANDPDAAIELG